MPFLEILPPLATLSDLAFCLAIFNVCAIPNLKDATSSGICIDTAHMCPNFSFTHVGWYTLHILFR